MTCKVCGFDTSKRGLMPHVKQRHGLSQEGYIALYGEYRSRESSLIDRSQSSNIKCLICNDTCASERHLSYHLKLVHNIAKRDYIIKYILNDNIPLCKCGCGKPVKIVDRGKPPYWSQYISGHNIYDTHIGAKRSYESKMKMRESAIKRLQDKNSVFYSAASKQEFEFAKWIKDETGLTVITSNKTILSGLELDIYIPDKNIAIEINGMRFHSDLYKDRYYHLKKTEECHAKGIRLVHIWSCDLLNKEDIVKSQIKTILSLQDSNKIYARKCQIKEVSSSEATIFLNDNHLQGSVVSKYRYGLYYNNQLVQIMTFGKTRKMSGRIDKGQSYELLRLCSNINTIIVGGATKLFNHFIKQINPDYILSYANRDWSIGNIYTNLNMSKIGYTPPGYFYSNGKRKLTRYQCQKHELIKLGFDKNMSEYDIMTSRGYYRIWDCGNIKYEWVK